MRPAAARLATAIALVSATASAQTTAPALAAAPAPADAAAPAPADTGAKSEAELAASRKAVQDLEAQVIELRRLIDASDRSRAAVDDLRRRLDELEARVGENDRRDEALEAGAGQEAGIFRFREDGFAIRSPNGRFFMVPHLRLQTVYVGVLAAKGTQDSAPPDVSQFLLTHAELILEGHVGVRQLSYRLQIDAAESPTINDAYIQAAPLRAFAVRAGQFKIPYGYQRWTYSGDLEFVDISAPMAAFQLNREIGLMAVGRPLGGRVSYEVSVTNGSPPGTPNDNIDLAYAARVVAAPWGPLPPGEGDLEWTPRPRARLGVAGYYNLVPTDVIARTGDPQVDTDQDNDGRRDNVGIYQGGVELRAIWRGAALQAEWFGRYEIPGGIYAARSYWGGYVQASYFVIRSQLQLAGRIGRTDEPRYGSTLQERLLFGTRVNEQSAAISWYLRGQRVKAQVDYTHQTHEYAATGAPAGTAPTIHRVRAAFQLGF